MDLAEAKLILSTATKSELRDHAFGDCEVEWYIEKTDVAHGYFSGTVRSVSFANGEDSFEGSEADELRKCFASEEIERNDETGPDEFEVGRIMPGLTKAGVYQELTGNDIPAHLRDDAPVSTCNKCGRESVTEFGKTDTMTQPTGQPCGGTFSTQESSNGR